MIAESIFTATPLRQVFNLCLCLAAIAPLSAVALPNTPDAMVLKTSNNTSLEECLRRLNEQDRPNQTSDQTLRVRDFPEKTSGMTPEERQKLRDQLREYGQKSSPDERAKLERERWQGFTPEERQKFRQDLRDHRLTRSSPCGDLEKTSR